LTLALTLTCGFLVLTGCGGKKAVVVKGKYVLPPDVKLNETDSVQINFVPEDPSGKGAGAVTTTKDSTFTVQANKGEGIKKKEDGE